MKKEFDTILEMKAVQASIGEVVQKEAPANQVNVRNKMVTALANISDRFVPALDQKFDANFANELELAFLDLPPEVQQHFDPLINKLSTYRRKQTL